MNVHRHGRRSLVLLRPLSIADELAEENAVTNGGRGSSTIRLMIDLLKRGKEDEARVVWDCDGDKVRQYPRLYALAVRLVGE